MNQSELINFSNAKTRKTSNMNALKKGFYCKNKDVLLSFEKYDEYKDLYQAYLKDFDPKSHLEKSLLEELVMTLLKKRRLLLYERELINNLNDDKLKQKELILQRKREFSDFYNKEKEEQRLQVIIESLHKDLKNLEEIDKNNNDELEEELITLSEKVKKIIEFLINNNKQFLEVQALIESLDEELDMDTLMKHVDQGQYYCLQLYTLDLSIDGYIEDKDLKNINSVINTITKIMIERVNTIRDEINKYEEMLQEEFKAIGQQSTYLPGPESTEYLQRIDTYLDKKIDKILEKITKIRSIFDKKEKKSQNND